MDPVILGELHPGILILPPGRKRSRLEDWFESLAGTIRCLPWDAAVTRRWAALVAALRRRGRAMPLLDGMIAATALRHGLTVATRNTGDFRTAGVPVVDPFA